MILRIRGYRRRFGLKVKKFLKSGLDLYGDYVYCSMLVMPGFVDFAPAFIRNWAQSVKVEVLVKFGFEEVAYAASFNFTPFEYLVY